MILVKLVQPSNAQSPILVTLFGIVILVKLVQPLNADSPILVTLFGIVILVKLVHQLNADSPTIPDIRNAATKTVKNILTTLAPFIFPFANNMISRAINASATRDTTIRNAFLTVTLYII